MSEQKSSERNASTQRGPGGHGLGSAVEKPKAFKETWQKLITYCKNYMPVVVVALLLAGIGTILQVIGPDRLGAMTNEIMNALPSFVDGQPVVSQINMSVVRNIGTFLAVLYALAWALNFAQGYMMATITQRVSQNMRTDISQKINKLPLKYFDNVSHGDVLSRVTNDVDTIGQTMSQSIGTMVTAITMLIGSSVMMFYNNIIMTLTAIATSVIGFVLMSVVMKKSQKYFVDQQKNMGAINSHIEENYTNHNIVKLYNGYDKSKEKFDEINDALYMSAWKSQFLSGLMMPIMMFIGNFGYVAVSVVGAMLVLRGSIEFGVIVAFMIYIRLFTQPLSQIAQSMQNLQRTAAASERVFEFLEQEEMSDEADKTNEFDNVSGAVEFKNINFGYKPEKTIINNFSAKISAGQKIAIVGPTGAGKTTIVNLLMRFYELNGGEILIDGIKTTDVTRQNVHDQFCMVLQDTWLFEGTIRENIVYNKKDVSDEQLKTVCKAAGLHQFIKQMPNRYDTVLNENTSLSQGQKQLVTIARAMLQNAPILILDEATSSLDTRTEHIIQKAMDELTKGRTSFVIAHRLSTIKNADVILVMKDGDIIESGSHDELIQQKGFYEELYNSQFEAAV